MDWTSYSAVQQWQPAFPSPSAAQPAYIPALPAGINSRALIGAPLDPRSSATSSMMMTNQFDPLNPGGRFQLHGHVYNSPDMIVRRAMEIGSVNHKIKLSAQLQSEKLKDIGTRLNSGQRGCMIFCATGPKEGKFWKLSSKTISWSSKLS